MSPGRSSRCGTGRRPERRIAEERGRPGRRVRAPGDGAFFIREDQGYGLVTGLNGRLIPNLVMTSASQEHGILTARDGATVPDLPLDTRLRVLPHHACATAAQHQGYYVTHSARSSNAPVPAIEAFWPRITGW